MWRLGKEREEAAAAVKELASKSEEMQRNVEALEVGGWVGRWRVGLLLLRGEAR